MPTHSETGPFLRDYKRLDPSQRARFEAALRRFVADLKAMEEGRRAWFRHGLRVHSVHALPGMFEMSWDADGRALFSWGNERIPGRRHVQWHRCGSHDILP